MPVFCTQCGQQNPDDSRFCARCGHQLERSGAGAADATSTLALGALEGALEASEGSHTAEPESSVDTLPAGSAAP